MAILVDEVVKSQTITWEIEGGNDIAVDVVDGDYTDPDAVQICRILYDGGGFAKFIKAIKQAMKDTMP